MADSVAIQLRTSGRLVQNTSDTRPSVDDDGSTLQLGTELLLEDIGLLLWWNGSAWEAPTHMQKVHQLVELQMEIRDLLQNLVESEE